MKMRLDTTAAALLVLGTLATSLPRAALADDVNPPPVPADLEVEAGNRPFLIGHAVGTQNYVCVPSGAGFAWSLFTPQATLFADDGGQVITHFFSPSPIEDVIRATWQHSRDSSAVWAQSIRPPSFDPAFVAPGAVAWLLLKRTQVQEGPTGGDRLTVTTFIQRVNTAGGLAPSTGCASPADVGARAFVPYEADYVFYRSDDPR